ncbi:MAG: MarR family winged helix-turn-helix transcriptional regulator [Burkholderiaceae bacterium]
MCNARSLIVPSPGGIASILVGQGWRTGKEYRSRLNRYRYNARAVAVWQAAWQEQSTVTSPPPRPAGSQPPPGLGNGRVEDRPTFLVHRITARLQQVCNPVISPYGLDLYSSRIVAAVAQAGKLRIGDLVELMVLPQSTISHQVKRLEALGYVKRTRSSRDNRLVEVTLTPLGQEAAKVCMRLSETIHDSVVDALSATEVDTLRRLLAKMFDALPDAGEIDIGRGGRGLARMQAIGTGVVRS